MADPQNPEEPGLRFTQTDAERTSWKPWIIAGVAVVLAIIVILVVGGRTTAVPIGSGPGLAPLDAYAPSLTISDLKMSESSNFAGGKVTYVDGKVSNHGSQALTGITVQVAFRNDLKEIAQKETMPLNLIRTREPYVDTQPVSASPLKPGEEREFRLIFDSVASGWNQQYPEIRVVQVRSSK